MYFNLSSSGESSVAPNVSNATSYDMSYMADALAVLDIPSTVSVMVVYVNGSSGLNGTFTRNNKNSYTLFVAKGLGENTAKKTVIHELVHIKQSIDERLIAHSLSSITYDGEMYNTGMHGDKKMKHEVDAEKKTSEVISTLKKIKKESKKDVVNKKFRDLNRSFN